MEEFNVEVGSLKHNFWQILNLSKQLLARNEVLKAKLKEQERSFDWKVAEMQKTIDDLKRKNAMLQKKLATDEDGVSVVSKEYHDVVKENFSQGSPKDSYDFYKNPEPQNLNLREETSSNLNEGEEDDEDNYSQESDKHSANSV